MAKPLGPERGLVKYIIKTPLTIVGFISMYIFGGSIFSVASGLTHLFTNRSVMEAIMVYFFTVPPANVHRGRDSAGFHRLRSSRVPLVLEDTILKRSHRCHW